MEREQTVMADQARLSLRESPAAGLNIAAESDELASGSTHLNNPNPNMSSSVIEAQPQRRLMSNKHMELRRQQTAGGGDA